MVNWCFVMTTNIVGEKITFLIINKIVKKQEVKVV